MLVDFMSFNRTTKYLQKKVIIGSEEVYGNKIYTALALYILIY